MTPQRHRRPPRWVSALLVLGVLLGAAAGVGGYTFVYARGGSYFTDDPTTCANCHVMQGQYDGWVKSSHRAVATCNDCHAPHDSLAAKLWVKGRNGWNHSLAFTTGRFPEPVMITEANRRVTEGACRHCHQDVAHAIDRGPDADRSLSCIRCHRGVGHLP